MMKTSTTWRKELAAAMKNADDDGPVVAYAPNEEAFDVKFNPGYGGSEGPAVLAWTADHVYFPVTYDGAEWMSNAPRNPLPVGQPHVGGE